MGPHLEWLHRELANLQVLVIEKGWDEQGRCKQRSCYKSGVYEANDYSQTINPRCWQEL